MVGAGFPPILAVTTENIPGFEVTATIGEVHGTAAVDAAPGTVPELSRVRDAAVTEMKRAARRRGANAVIGMRFDAGTAGELCAYGTAVRAERIRLSAVPSLDEAPSGSGGRSVSGTPGRWPPTSAGTSTCS